MTKAFSAGKPVIGIAGNFGDKGCGLAVENCQSVDKAGGIPLVVPLDADESTLSRTLDHIDALLLAGGDDTVPLSLNEEPLLGTCSVGALCDGMELMLVREAYHRQMPMLGVCRGMRVLALVLGDRLRVSSRTDDGVAEAVESVEYKSILGVRRLPGSSVKGDEMSKKSVLGWLVDQASSFMEAKRIHTRILSLDSHCDTPMLFAEGYTPDMFARRTDKVLVDLPKMNDGHLDAVVMAAYLRQEARDAESLAAASAKADDIITHIEEMVSANSTQVGLAYTPEDLPQLKKQGKKAVMIGIENGYAIGKDLSLLEHFRNRGVVYMTLCHNGDNDICDSAKGHAEHGGLSTFGKEVVREMNRLGMMVDLSHAAESTFYDTLRTSVQPVVCSHSCCKALCHHPRNLTDAQMLALKANGGVMQVTLYHGFLREDGEATVEDFVRHIKHAVDVMGIDYVGIGSDFDGDGGVRGAASASDVINITRRLMENGFGEPQLRKLWGANFLRVMSQVQRV